MDNEGKTTIENLRKDLENKHRFTSVWRGYNKKEVNDYMQNMENEQARRIEEERNSVKEEQERSKELILHWMERSSQIRNECWQSSNGNYDYHIASCLFWRLYCSFDDVYGAGNTN